MPRSTLLQNQFTRGELSPRMKGRVDLDQYFQGAQTQVNFLSLPHGGPTGRPGSVYVAEVRSSSSSQRLLDFIFSTSDAYVLEFCNQTIRFFRNRGQIVSADTDASITNGTFDSGITGWTDQSTGVATIAHDASNLTLQLNGNGSDIAIAEQAPTTTSTGTEHVLRFDVIGASTSGLVKVRIGSTSGGVDYLAETSFKNGYHCIAFTPAASPFYIQFRNEENAAHDIDNVSLIDNAPIEISSPYADGDLFPIQYVQDADRMFLVHPSYKPMELTRSGHSSWSLTSYTPTADVFTSADNYPAAVALFEQRLVFGFTNTNPQTLYFSKSADIQDMTTGTGASDGFTKTLFASQANPIRWVVGGSDLIIGTTGGEWVVDRPASSAVTVSNFSVKRRETSGVANLAPAEVDNRVLFMARRGAATNNGEDLLEFRFDDDEAEFVAPDLTLVSEHITDGGIVEMAWQQRGWKGSYQSIDLPSTKRILWLVRSDGVLLTFTYNFPLLSG